MLLNDFSTFSKISKSMGQSERNKTAEKRSTTEVDRLYCSSLMILESSTTYEQDQFMGLIDAPTGLHSAGKILSAIQDDGISFPSTTDVSNKNTITDSINDQRTTSKNVRVILKDNGGDSKNMFKAKPIPRVQESPPVSCLTQNLEEIEKVESKMNRNSSRVKLVALTIYLPDYTPMNIAVKESSVFEEVIDRALAHHKINALQPPLRYDEPQIYDLRQHDEDGEPDRDFPPLELDKELRNFNLDEYCLCENERAAPPASSMFKTDTLFTISSMHDRGTKDKFANDFPSYDDEIEGDENIVIIIFPNGIEVEIPYNKDDRMIDLLPLIAKTHRIRLYRNEYIFVMSEQDQARLMLMSPVTNLQSRVEDLGTHTFQIQKKVYADSVRQSKRNKHTNKAMLRGTKQDVNNIVVMTDATANAYQEWNVIKKNKFGRKQERIFGADGRKVYNAKRGQLKSSAGVQRAERDISTIQKIEILDERQTFRITWMDDRDQYNIEYICDSPRECAEIVTKIKYTLNKLMPKRVAA